MTKKIVNTAFSLIDFAIWITIFSVMVIGFLAISSAQNKHKNFVADNLEKQLIQDKIKSYVLKEISNNIRNNNIILHKSCDDQGNQFTEGNPFPDSPLPCPSESEAGIVTSGIVEGEIKNNIGYVPYKTLGLNQEDVIDSNNKFYLFLAYQINPQSQYQYYVFSQTEEAINGAYINKITNSTDTKNQNQNTIIPTQIPNCHIAVTKTENNYIDILSGGSYKKINCSNYNILPNTIYKNNVNKPLPSNTEIVFTCFSGNNDYEPQDQQCERVCTTFSTGDATYNIDPLFLNGTIEIGANNYSNIYTALRISPNSILKLKCGTNYVYEVDSITTTEPNPCQTDYILDTDKKSCKYTCAISSNSIGVGSNTTRYSSGTTYQDIINDTTCISNTKAKDSTLSTQKIACTEANPIITLTSGSDNYQICQCNSENYYVQNGTANECVKGCKMSLDVVGPGTLADRNKLYYPDQPVSDVFADTTCVTNATKDKDLSTGKFFTTEQIYLHPTNNNYCILRKKTTSPKTGKPTVTVENFKRKLCSCNSGYSMLAENSIANFFSSTSAFINFPGGSSMSSTASSRNFDAKYDCFEMCSATPSAAQSNLINTVDSKVIGYHSSNSSNPTTPTIINNLNNIAFRVGTTTDSDSYLFYDGTRQQKLQPLDCSRATGDSVDYCLETTNAKRLFSSQCSSANSMGNSLPSLKIKSGGSLSQLP